MKRISTEKAPKAVGPYSQAIRAGNFVFTAGQLGIDPVSGKMVEGGIRAQARQVMENLRSILAAAGSDFSKAVKTTVYINNINEFAVLNQVYGEYFSSETPPARSTVQAAALPLGALVEIEMVALVE